MLSQETLQSLIGYIDDLNNRYPEILEKEVTDNEKIMVNNLAFWEESWEFNDQILRKLWFAFNKNKRNNFKQEDLEDEAADTLICLIMLIRSLWITDMNEMIKRKIEKNNKRWY